MLVSTLHFPRTLYTQNTTSTKHLLVFGVAIA